MSYLRLILHGKAAQREPIREAVNTVRDEGHRVEVRVTWEAGDAVRYAKEAAADGVDTVVAVGGDGTLNEVASGIVDGSGPPKCSMALMPQGTANDFARGMTIPLDPTEALRLAADPEQARPMDIGLITGRIFVNIASGGVGCKMTVETPPEMKQMLGGLSYLITGARRFDEIQPIHGRFRGPDFEWEGEFRAMAVGNGVQTGNGIPLTARAKVDDGKLDLMIMPEVPEGERMAMVGKLLKEGQPAIEREIVYHQASWFEAEVPEGLNVNLDGEQILEQKLRYEVREHWLRFHLPASAPLVGG